MKKTYRMLTIVFAALFLTVHGAYAIELGMPFGFGHNTTFGAHDGRWWGSDVGLRIHLNEKLAFQPYLSLSLADNQTNVGLNVDALIYMSESNGIRQYAGVNLGINIAENDDSGDLRFGGIYGLQHPIAPAVDIFGQVGLGFRFDPGRLYTVNTQLGVIFYIKK